ncbi:Sec-independent protein translocase subunit TatB [Pseudomonas sp. LPB0260]|uniref:Sec-independent protein translocase protein TatB n=1 Tax=Pseudomonas sp. LPB0260 TaxID=2614442 RepID=UPI0015C27529|nr:Sec-independent protein translocase protein TatB [Pseudomonas sp. LPB0260]QLC73467.1 Sec-independent protein translocase subunit TatB [Pseudomonas sp. LPB0260]QLC76241.1 Sec-independent protein translocase subunit TatB [Pseudomonas sp. LPB0260]
MFDIGFSELLLIGLVALLVLGPERLPGAVRTAGLWIGRIKRSFSAIKAEVEREIGADEIRRQLHNEQILELEREMKAMKQDLLSPGAATKSEAPAGSEAPAKAEQPAATAEPAASAPKEPSQDKSAQP